MGTSNKKTEKDNSLRTFNLTLAAVAGQVGCLTIIIIFAALFGGLWLDNNFDTRPLFTIALMIISVPITLVIMFWIVRRATSSMQINESTIPESPETEDNESGK